MLMNEISRATLVLGLAALQADPKLNLPKGSIKPLIGDAAWADIERTKADYKSFNESMAAGLVGLSAESKAYWTEVRKCIDMGKRAQSTGSRTAEKRVSLWSEKLEESFPFLVPEHEHGAFVQHVTDDQDPDPLWSFVESRPPLLRPELRGGVGRVNPMNEAQVTVIGSLLDYRENEAEMEFARDQLVAYWTEANAKLREEEAVQARKEAKRTAAIHSQGEREAKAQRKAVRDAKIAAGDQKLTKAKRTPGVVMNDLFDVKVSLGNGRPKRIAKPKGSK